MTTSRVRWLLVAIAILGLAIAAPAVSAHGGDEPTTDETDRATTGPSLDGSTPWNPWMYAQMVEHMGADAADRMTAWMGPNAADGNGPMFRGGPVGGMGSAGGMAGQGPHC